MSEPLLVKFKCGAYEITASVRDLNKDGQSNPDAVFAFLVSATYKGADVSLNDFWTGAQVEMKEIAIKKYHKLKATTT